MWRQIDAQDWVKSRRASLQDVREPVSKIIAQVRDQGDKALFELTERYDKTRLSTLSVAADQIAAAYSKVDQKLINDLKQSKERIERFHALQVKALNWEEEVEPGVKLGMCTMPMDRVGAYVPGGRAAYPSTALMCVVPAKVAGVGNVICCTPPPIRPLILVALDIAGADEIYSIGGAQAIAAMALGTTTISPVQKIVGPGNIYVTVAKMLLKDHVEIDFPAGPSELAVLADETANPFFIAADIIAQAEHDPDAACALVTTDRSLAEKVGKHIEKMMKKAERREVIACSLPNCGYVLVRDIAEGIEKINEIAPEHLSIQVNEPRAIIERIRNAGAIFVGPYSAVACGDYSSGTNHVLPTAGYARTFSGLDIRHFCKSVSIQEVSREGLKSIGPITMSLAEAEGLQAHSESVRIRLEKQKNERSD
jgi:histidinol dehydrogenase